MPTVNVRDLQRNPARILRELEDSGQPAFVTRNGRPVAVLMPLDEEALLDHVLANAPEYVADMRRADDEIAQGDVGTPLDEVMADLRREG
ncbi:MAG: type II toxin-antitoxin system Phd/YefM family antitoxin [Candidatus Dormiibacterota bacterium]